MQPDPSVLAAGEVRARLFGALEHVVSAAEATFADVDPADVIYLIQAHPLFLQVARRATRTQPAKVLTAFRGERLPAPLAMVLAEAVEALAAGVLTRLGESGAAMAVSYAAQVEGGGLVALADPLGGFVALILAVEGRPLDAGILLGAITDAEVTAN